MLLPILYRLPVRSLRWLGQRSRCPRLTPRKASGSPRAVKNRLQVAGMSNRLVISQKDNFAANFGDVLRSSAIFWARNDAMVHTTISFSNYWRYRNNADVAVIANVRDMQGKLLSRSPISFDQSEVCNFTPPRDFEGSIEIEVFGNRNMRIPYAAIMGIYETAEGISMVHSYARAYSQHEIEDGRTISNGEESCWTLRDNENLISFAAFHNGAHKQAAQQATLKVRNHMGEERFANIELAELAPFETTILTPADHLRDLSAFLDGQPGNARLSYALAGGFTRMLCGVRRPEWSELQVTHSNFDYSTHDTDKLDGGTAYMVTPTVPEDRRQEIVVYPDTSEGDYHATFAGGEVDFSTGQIVRLSFDDNSRRTIAFTRNDNVLPSRMVTALRLYGTDETIPAECSLGIVHAARPPKGSAWMPVSQKFSSKICWADYSDVYGGCPEDATWTCELYPPNRKEPYRATLSFGDFADRPFLTLEEMFGPVDLGGDFGYLSLRSSYGGFMIFSTLQKGDSLTMEHSF